MSDEEATIPSPGPAAAESAYEPHRGGRLVVGVDGSAGSTIALQWAVAEAHLRAVEVHLVMAWLHPQSYGAASVWTMMMDRTGVTRESMADTTESQIHRIGSDAVRGQSVAITWEAVEGHPAEVLVRMSEGAGALVVGSRGHGGFIGALLGSVSQHVVAHARCPVILIPDPAREGLPS